MIFKRNISALIISLLFLGLGFLFPGQLLFRFSTGEVLSANGGILSGVFTIKKADDCLCDNDGECFGGYCCLRAPGETEKFCQSTPCSAFPQAIIACQTENCNGPGCQCNGSWITYNGDKVIYKILNKSIPEDRIVKSTWSIVDWQAPWFSCNDKCDMTVPKIAAGNYTIELKIEDQTGFSDTATRQIRIKQDAIANFMCSLDNENWYSCEEISPWIGETVYLKDDPSLPIHSSPSEDGSAIVSRLWKLNGGVIVADDPTNPSVIFNQLSNRLELTIIDNANRQDTQEYAIRGSFPLPKWKEIIPF